MLIELAITFAAAFMTPARQQPRTTQIIYVKESREPCTGVAPMECLQVKRSNDSAWSNLYTTINGFKYTPGYRYKLKVRVTKIKHPPADGASLKYTLVRMLEKKKVSPSGDQATGVFDKKWVLVKMDGAAVPGTGIWMEFDPPTKRVHGKSGCNGLMGAYSTSGNNITFNQTAGTLMACPDEEVMRREVAFMKHLSDRTFQYEVAGPDVNLLENGEVALQFSLQDKAGSPDAAAAGSAPPDDRLWAFIGSKKWNVIKLNDETLIDSGIWIEFDTAQQRFHGKGGCNSISGSYQTTNDQISFSQGISTRMACPDANVMRREAAFLKLLSEHTFRYDVAEQTLNLYEDGKIVVMFGVSN
jgi:heat shock protein HslJ